MDLVTIIEEFPVVAEKSNLVFDGEPVTIDLQYGLAYFFVSVMIRLAALIDFLSSPVKKRVNRHVRMSISTSAGAGVNPT